jgi:hypothetical protein
MSSGLIELRGSVSTLITDSGSRLSPRDQTQTSINSKIDQPGEEISQGRAALPFILGFEIRDSMVVAAVGETRRLGVVARCDLPGVGEVRGVAATLAAPAGRGCGGAGV